MDKIKNTIRNVVGGVKKAVSSVPSLLTASAISSTKKTMPTTPPGPMSVRPLTPAQAGINQTLVPTRTTALGPAADTGKGQTVVYTSTGPMVFPTGDVPLTASALAFPPSAPSTISRTLTKTSSPLLTNEPLARSASITSETFAPSPIGTVVMPTNTGTQNISPVNNAGLQNIMTDAGYTMTPTGQFVTTPQETQQPKEQQISSITGQLSDLISRAIPQKRSVFENEQVRQQQEEVNRRKQEVSTYTSQLNSIVAKQQADLLRLREVGSREGVTEAVYGGQELTINREAAIRALPIQAQIASAQGFLEIAQDYLKELITIKNDQIDSEYEYNKNVYNTLKSYADATQKRILDRIDKQEDRAFELQKSNLSALAKAYESVGNNPTAINALKRINLNSPTAQLEISKEMGKYKVDTLKISANVQSDLVSGGFTNEEINKINNGVNTEGLMSVIQKEINAGQSVEVLRSIANAYSANSAIMDLIDQYELGKTSTETVTGFKNWWGSLFK